MSDMLKEKLRLQEWLYDLIFELESLNADAFHRHDLDKFKRRKNKILLQYISATISIEQFLESEGKKNVENN